jgi:hypothetical protein
MLSWKIKQNFRNQGGKGVYELLPYYIFSFSWVWKILK